MRQRREGGGAIYQVDLIAALFAGYTMVWLVTSDKQEIVRAPNELILGSLRMSIDGRVNDAGSDEPFRQRAALADLVTAACVPDSFDDFVDRGEIDVAFCTTSAKPRLSNDFKDSLSVLEVLEEPCAASGNRSTSAPEGFDRVVDASLIDLSLPASFTLIGGAYSDVGIWPEPELYGRPELVPRYVGIEGVPGPAPGEAPFACAYRRDRANDILALFIVDDEASLPDTLELVVGSSGGDLFHVYKPNFDTAEAFFSQRNTLEPGALLVGGDWKLKQPELTVRVCLHEDGAARACWSGSGPLTVGGTITAFKEG